MRQVGQAPDFEHVARAVMALSGVPVEQQENIVTEMYSRLDKAKARARRDELLRSAFHAIGGSPSDFRILASTVRDYRARVWPRFRHLAEPPPDHQHIYRLFFLICRTAADANICIPDEKQVRRICGHSAIQMSERSAQHEGSTNNTGTDHETCC